jgi:hypothetical protein
VFSNSWILCSIFLDLYGMKFTCRTSNWLTSWNCNFGILFNGFKLNFFGSYCSIGCPVQKSWFEGWNSFVFSAFISICTFFNSSWREFIIWCLVSNFTLGSANTLVIFFVWIFGTKLPSCDLTSLS